MKILIVNNANHPIDYSELSVYGEITYIHWKEIPKINFSSLLSEHPTILVTGGSQHLYALDATPELHAELDFLREAIRQRCPIIGICLGFQILNVLLGNEVVRLDTPCIGHGYLDETTVSNWPETLSLTLVQKAFSFHHDGVLMNKNPEIDVLAYSKEGLVYCMQHKTLPIFGIQSHPDAMGKEIETCCTKYGVKLEDLHDASVYQDIFDHFFAFCFQRIH